MKVFRLSNLLFLLMLVSFNTFSEPKLIKIYCPNPKDVKSYEQTGSWAKYRYVSYTPIDLPDIGNKLELIGQGDSSKATTLQAATWTDRLFLCLYDYGLEVIVIFDTVLDKYVKLCYFNGNPRHSECISSDPSACPITCELA